MNEQEYREMLLTWKAGEPGFSRDDMILAVGLQCKEKRFLIGDVFAWLGYPDKVIGSSSEGHVAYYYADGADNVPLFDVAEGRVVGFGTISRFIPNAIRPDGKTEFNYLDEMEPFDNVEFM